MIKRDLMDPKALNHLDPRARETYDRIMGTAHDATLSTPNTTMPNPISDQAAQDPSMSGLTADATNPLLNNSDPNNMLSTSPTASPLSDPMAANSMSSAPPAPMPSISDSFVQQSATESTDPSAALFASSQQTSPMEGVSTNTDQLPPSAFFATPSQPPVEPQPEMASAQAFSSLDSNQPQTQPQPNDPMAPIQPYNPANEGPQAQVFTQPLPSPEEVSQATAPHETSSLLKVLYIVGAVVFFAIYTIFWVKVFNLPFLF